MAQGSGRDVIEDKLARKNKAKASQQSLVRGSDEIDFDPETMMITSPSSFGAPRGPAMAPQLKPGGGSFGDAFAAARAAQGPGGTFEWNGKMYTTDRADDRMAMPGAFPGAAQGKPVPSGAGVLQTMAAGPGPAPGSALGEGDIYSFFANNPILATLLGIGGGAAGGAALTRGMRSRAPSAAVSPQAAVDAMTASPADTAIRGAVEEVGAGRPGRFQDVPDEAVPTEPATPAADEEYGRKEFFDIPDEEAPGPGGRTPGAAATAKRKPDIIRDVQSIDELDKMSRSRANSWQFDQQDRNAIAAAKSGNRKFVDSYLARPDRNPKVAAALKRLMKAM